MAGASVKGILLGNKAPLIISAALTIFGWYFTTIAGYLSNETAVQVSQATGPEGTGLTIQNVSINKTALNQIFLIRCADNTNCLQSLQDGPTPEFGRFEAVAPYAIDGNRLCNTSQRSIQFSLTLPPGGQAKVRFKPSGTGTKVFFQGRASTPCQTDKIEGADTQVFVGSSVTVFFLSNFLIFFLVSFALLAVLFLAAIVRLMAGWKS
jgi:hypothetical protein